MWTAWRPTVSFSPGDWEVQDPAPLDNTTTYGYALAVSASTVYFSRPGKVVSAGLTVSLLDMSADLVEARIEERDGLRQRAELVFDNSAGQYVGLTAPTNPIRRFRDVALTIGYDAEDSDLPSQSIVGWEYRREGGRALFVLRTEGCAYWLARSRSRTTIRHTSSAATTITRKAAARAGLDLASLGASSRASGFTMDWVVHPHQTALDALSAVLELLSDIYLTQSPGFSIGLHNPASGDSVDYNLESEGHPIYATAWATAPVASWSEIAAEGVLGRASDFTEMDFDKPLLDRRRDPHATAEADASAYASARLRRSVLGRDLGSVRIAPHCGLEIGDVLAYSDALVSGSTVTGRVKAITTLFRRQPSGPGRAMFEQRVELGGL
jgi:hypothetical protein